MSDWRRYVVFEDRANGVRLIEEHGPYGVWCRRAEPGYACFDEAIQTFERTMRQGRRRTTRLVNRDGTPTLRLLHWQKKSQQST
jgi:hypothetical protein